MHFHHSIILIFNPYLTGLQEYIEAVSFWNYLKHNTLVSCHEVQDQLKFTVLPKEVIYRGTCVLADADLPFGLPPSSG